jgi:stress-induced-phosphoprotein 1
MEREAGAASGGAADGDPMGSLGQMFSDPQLIPKIANNPRTSHLLADTEFMMKLQRVRQDPGGMGQEIIGDQRFLAVLGVLMNMDIQMGGPGSEAEQRARAAQSQQDPVEEEDTPMPDAKPTSAPKRADPEPEIEDEASDDEDKLKREAKAKADAEKKLGTDAYKKRQFDQAIEHYSKAWELHKDMTYLTNLGAAYFEKGDYEKCIEVCKEAVSQGREMLADFKLIAK